MWTHTADLELLMDRLAEVGVAMLVRVDVERLRAGRPQWTLFLSGPLLHPANTIRVDARTLGDGLTKALDRLRGQPGDWEWLDAWV
ncbi:hypothetical protein [Nocardia huaxiensis]|uniref:Uncharacterized protein n=1 Tax=Nocardia huaxiensis TaxID=2755382 RepID=A0A7D6VHN9_9NOCA|nr:hypothetical protein [Nocardia huaxiensis]QLY29790.1 hypothetical protein H0264_31975 [Nocardia huaxiensis]UFS96622.1 hypothetical protein LPY97_01395 [Nocardia huaxiensis]